MRAILLGFIVSCAVFTVAAAAPHTSTGWRYSASTNPMHDEPDKLACVLSQNPVRLSFPYRSQRLRFCVRHQAKSGLNIYVDLPYGGQFSCGVDGCDVQVRFDQDKPTAFSANVPTDGSDNTLFFNDEQALFDGLVNAKRMVVEATFYRAGDQDLVFDVHGLKWNTEPKATAAASAPTPPPPPPAPVLRQDVNLNGQEFERQPSRDDILAYYPDRAQRMNQAGNATIRCAVTATGTLAECALASEIPTDFGFGQAALKLAHLFKLRPDSGIATGSVSIAFNP